MKRNMFRVTAGMLALLWILSCVGSASAMTWVCRSCGNLADGSRCSRCGDGVNYQAIGYGIISTGSYAPLTDSPHTIQGAYVPLYDGDYVTVFSEYGSWLEVDAHGSHGFVEAQYVDWWPEEEPDPDPGADPVWGWANQRLSTRTGPGTNYDGKGVTVEYPAYANSSVQVFSAAWDSRNHIWWMQVEVEKNGHLRRAYTGLKRIDGVDEYSVRQEYVMYENARLTASVTAYHGPGTWYQSAGRLSAGMWGRVIWLENGYAQFEYEQGGYKVRCWVPQDCVNMY